MPANAPENVYDRDYLVVNAANAFYSLHATMFIFMPAYLYTLKLSAGVIGLLMATGTLTSVLCKPLNGWLVNRGRHALFLSAGALFSALATLPWLSPPEPGAALFFLRAIQGVAYSFFATAAFGYVAAAAPPARRGEALGVFGLSFFIPTAFGGQLGELIVGRAGFHGMFAWAILAALPAIALPALLRRRHTGATLDRTELRVFFSLHGLVPNTAGFLFGAAYGTIFTFLPVFLMVRHGGTLGHFVLVYSAAVVATRTLGRRLADRLPRPWVCLAALLLLAAGILGIPWLRGNLELTLVGVATGLGHGFLFPALSAMTVDRAGPGREGMAMALYTGSFDLGTVAGSGLLGFVAERLGYAPMFGIAAGLTAAGAAIFLIPGLARRKG
jgi:predicted MFS family arabinose efflux permease